MSKNRYCPSLPRSMNGYYPSPSRCINGYCPPPLKSINGYCPSPPKSINRYCPSPPKGMNGYCPSPPRSINRYCSSPPMSTNRYCQFWWHFEFGPRAWNFSSRTSRVLLKLSKTFEFRKRLLSEYKTYNGYRNDLERDQCLKNTSWVF